MINVIINQFPDIKRTVQISSFYCGPAVLEMLLSHLDINTDQKELVLSIHADQKTNKHGMTIGEMAFAVKHNFPQIQFWYKNHGTINDMDKIIYKYKHPVGIEWRGLFDFEDIVEEDDDVNPGHYSLVTGINLTNNEICILDPEQHYAGRERLLNITDFETRWWDINSVFNPVTHKQDTYSDHHMLFIITQCNEDFPNNMKMIKY